MITGKQDKKVTEALGKMLQYAHEPYPIYKAVKEKLAVMDPANVCMIRAKSRRAKEILTRFIEKDEGPSKIPSLDFSYSVDTRYSIDYIKIAVEIFKVCGDNTVHFRAGEDYPLQMENKHFAFILAPRVNHDV